MSSSVCSLPFLRPSSSSYPSPSLHLPQSVAPAVQAVGAVCHAASSVGGAPSSPPWEHRPDRFHNFCAHDAQLCRASETSWRLSERLSIPVFEDLHTNLELLLRQT